MTTLTMRIDAPMEAALARLAKATHRSKSDLAREMLRRQLAVRGFQALREQALPPTAHLDRIDPACAGVDHVTSARCGGSLRTALSNSFAFGGSNAVLAFRTAASG